MSRTSRKVDHLKLAVQLEDGPAKAGFEDVVLVHCPLPELNLEEIDISSELFGKTLAFPLVINALTGGAKETYTINKTLAQVARSYGLAMAVGSQRAALEDRNLRETFEVVREENPHGLILANLSCKATVDEAREAVAMVRADALQIHLNVPQELYMAEGDRDFCGCLTNIARLQKELEVPIIVKEVGFGISGEAARTLLAHGIKHIDVGGQGGTNFIAIEKLRRGEMVNRLEPWGISTLCSLVEVFAQGIPGTLVASGGVRTPLDCVKALTLGADAVGIANPFLKILLKRNKDHLLLALEGFKEELRRIMLMTGAGNVAALKKVPAVITGRTREWLNERGYDTKKYAQRNKVN